METFPVRCRAVLFDVDDTLYEVAHLVTQSWVVHAAELGELGLDVTALSSAYERHRYRRTIPDALALALASLGAPGDLSSRVHEISQGYTPLQLPVQTGVVELLEEIRDAGVATGVVTNGDPVRQLAKLDALGLADAFDAVVVCDGVRVPHKPHPAGFEAALAALGVSPNEALMVGDRVDYDILPALALGMHAIRVRVGNHAGAEGGSGVIESEDPALVWARVRDAVGLVA